MWYCKVIGHVDDITSTRSRLWRLRIFCTCAASSDCVCSILPEHALAICTRICMRMQQGSDSRCSSYCVKRPSPRHLGLFGCHYFLRRCHYRAAEYISCTVYDVDCSKPASKACSLPFNTLFISFQYTLITSIPGHFHLSRWVEHQMVGVASSRRSFPGGHTSQLQT